MFTQLHQLSLFHYSVSREKTWYHMVNSLFKMLSKIFVLYSRDFKNFLENEEQITDKHAERYYNRLRCILEDIKIFCPKTSAKEDKFNFVTILPQHSSAFILKIYIYTSTLKLLRSEKLLRALQLHQYSHSIPIFRKLKY